MSITELAPGTWEMKESDNFDKFLSEQGVGIAKRAIAKKVKPTEEISIAPDGSWTIKVHGLKTNEIKFTVDQEFDETSVDGKSAKSTFTIDGNTLTKVMVGEKITTKVSREFSEDTMKMKMTCNDVTCTRVYKKK